jgi:hypothetical protein
VRVNDTNSRSGNSRWASGAQRHLGAIQVNPEGFGRFPWHKVVFFCRGDRASDAGIPTRKFLGNHWLLSDHFSAATRYYKTLLRF